MVPLQTALLVLAHRASEEIPFFDFADWCGPCQQMDPVVRQWRQGVSGPPGKFRSATATGRPLRRRSAADLLMLVNGRVVDRVVGATSPERLEKCAFGPSESAEAEGRAVRPWPRALIPRWSFRRSTASRRFRPVKRSWFRVTVGGRRFRLASGGPLPEPSGKRGLSIANCSPQLCGCGFRTAMGSRAAPHDHRRGSPILTCGHIFRDSKAKGESRSICSASPAKGIPGNLISQI